MRNHRDRQLPFVVPLVLLAGCAGRGGGSSGVGSPFGFAQADAGILIGETIDYNVVGADPDSIDYATTDAGVATVATDGGVTAIAPGRARITADRRDDHAELSVQVTAAAIEVAGWVGASGAEVGFSAGAAGIEFYRSSEPGCDRATVGVCADGQVDVVAESRTVFDTALTLGRPAYYTLRNVDRVVAGSVSADVLHPIARHGAVEFGDRLWLVGGRNVTRKDWVWSSPDGVSWQQARTTAAFSPRSDPAVVVDRGRLWMIGGAGASGALADVWWSSDGETWVQATAAGAFGARSDPAAVAFDGRLWILGRGNGADVWSSIDGVAWTPVVADAPFGNRSGHEVAVHGDAMWLLGGEIDDEPRADVWASIDGADWSLVTGAADWPARTAFSALAHGGELWVVGGEDSSGEGLADAWHSLNGVSWQAATTSAPFASRRYVSLTSHRGRLVAVGGYLSGDYSDEVWSSADGVDWRRDAGTVHAFEPRTGAAMAACGDRLWLVGGDRLAGSPEVQNDVWSSPDGLHWRLEVEQASFAARAGHCLGALGGRLYLVGGGAPGAAPFADVWSTVDGLEWRLETAAAPFGAQTTPVVLAARDRLWCFAEDVATVWSSPDGAGWVQATTSASYPARHAHAVVDKDGTFFVVGGIAAADGRHLADVWSSSDGVAWTMLTADGGFGGRGHAALRAIDGKLLLIGGYDDGGAPLDGVWSSGDGVAWSRVVTGPCFEARAEFAVAESDGLIFLLGGSGPSANRLGDIWSSPDGVTWRRAFRKTFAF